MLRKSAGIERSADRGPGTVVEQRIVRGLGIARSSSMMGALARICSGRDSQASALVGEAHLFHRQFSVLLPAEAGVEIP